MIVKDIIFEDFINYKNPSMTIMFPRCSFKCDQEHGERICQNSSLALQPDIDIPVKDITKKYLENDITHSIVFQGLEPFDSLSDLYSLVRELRGYTDDDIVIYTGYNEVELVEEIEYLSLFNNIIVKFGRFIPNQSPHFDSVLGVNLASDNQYAKEVSKSNKKEGGHNGN